MKALSERVSLVPANRTVDEVVERLTTIERDLKGFFSPDGPGPQARRDHPPLPDGVACFNGMYLRVTEAVRDELPNFENREFIERLDVLFAEFYLQAYEAAAAEAWISEAWAPLFARRRDPKIIPLQFAITGMNAHINNDLAHALVLTWKEQDLGPAGDTPERRDYDKVNAILQAVEDEIKVPLSDELIAQVDALFGKTGRATSSAAYSTEPSVSRATPCLAHCADPSHICPLLQGSARAADDAPMSPGKGARR